MKGEKKESEQADHKFERPGVKAQPLEEIREKISKDQSGEASLKKIVLSLPFERSVHRHLLKM